MENTFTKLEETIDLMQSSDYKERFIAEYVQLKLRFLKLKKTNIKIDAGTLEFKNTCSVELLKQQQYLMNQLLDILEIRAEVENIELPIIHL